MKTSREVLLKSGLYPKLRLGERRGRAVVSTGPHKVKILEDKVIRKLNPEGVEEYYVRYIFEENGEKKQYDCHMKAKVGSDPHYLVQALSDVHEGEELILEMKKAGVKSYIEVTRTEKGETERVANDEEDEEKEENKQEQSEKPEIRPEDIPF
jgi:hypothetical protein